MKTKWVRLSVFGCELILAFVLAGGLSAQQAPTAGSPQGQAVPHLVKFSGAVKDADGKARTGVTGITFALYEDQAGGAALWLEMQNVTLDAQGRYTVLLGASTADGMPLEVFAANEARWLGVQPEGLPEYRILLVSVPYALKAAEAETLGGMPASSFVLAAPVATGSSGNSGSQTAGSGANNVNPGAVANTSTGTANYLPVFTSNAGDLGNSVLYQQATTNYLGIGTANPQYNFQLVVPGEDWLWGGFALVPAFSGGTNWNTLYGNGGSGFSLVGTGKNLGYPNSRLDMGSNSTINFQTGDGTAAPTSKLFITAAGNMGIGTITPGSKLEVAGNVKVSGTGSVLTFPDGTWMGSAATGTITGVTAGTDLLGGGTSGNVTLNLDTTKVVTGVTAGTGLTGGGTGGALTLNLDTTKVPQLNATNIFTGNQTINGTLSATGSGTNDKGVSGYSTGAAGVYGNSTNGYGVFGISSSSTAGGVYGFSSGGTGVSGNSTNAPGVSGNSTSGSGVYGTSQNNAGVFGVSNTYVGVYGAGGYSGLVGSGPTGLLASSSAAGGVGAVITNTAGGKILQLNNGSNDVLEINTYGTQLDFPIIANIPNNTTTGTVVNELAVLTGGTVSVVPNIDVSNGVFGVVVAGAGTSGQAYVALYGPVTCMFENAATVGDYVQVSNVYNSSTPVAGDCHDSGPYEPGLGTGQILGRVIGQSTTGAGLAQIFLYGNERRPTGPLASRSYTGQTAPIGSTTLFTPLGANNFRAHIYMTTPAGAITGGTIQGYITWQDEYGSQLEPVSLASGQTHTGANAIVFHAVPGQPIQFYTSFVSVTGTAIYDAFVTLETQ